MMTEMLGDLLPGGKKAVEPFRGLMPAGKVKTSRWPSFLGWKTCGSGF